MNKKNRSFWVLFGAGILCLLCAVLVYCFGGVMEELTDALSYRQTGSGGKITNDTFISQSFKCNHDNVKGLTFRVSTLGSAYDKAEAVFTLSDEKEQVLASMNLPLQGVKDKSAVTFAFEPLTGVGGKTLILKAQGKGLEEEQCYSLMVGQGNVGGMLTTADGKTSENSSLFLTVNYLNTVRAEKFSYFMMVMGVMLLSFLPMISFRKGGC